MKDDKLTTSENYKPIVRQKRAMETDVKISGEYINGALKNILVELHGDINSQIPSEVLRQIRAFSIQKTPPNEFCSETICQYGNEIINLLLNKKNPSEQDVLSVANISLMILSVNLNELNSSHEAARILGNDVKWSTQQESKMYSKGLQWQSGLLDLLEEYESSTSKDKIQVLVADWNKHYNSMPVFYTDEQKNRIKENEKWDNLIDNLMSFLFVFPALYLIYINVTEKGIDIMNYRFFQYNKEGRDLIKKGDSMMDAIKLLPEQNSAQQKKDKDSDSDTAKYNQ